MNFLKRLVKQWLPASSIPTDERRASVRLRVQVDISVEVDDGRVLPATVVNLTFTGLCLEIKTALKEGQDITLVREDFGPSFNGKVLWLRKGESGGFLVGVECELDEERLISSWLEPALVQAGFETEYVDERRKFIRVPGRVSCKLTDQHGRVFDDARMLDLSTGGALVICHQEMAVGSTWDFKTLPLGPLLPLEGRAEVLSAKPTEQGTWLHGLKFSASDSQGVKAYMDSMLKS